MDTELLVENRITDGRELILELDRDRFDVRVAFWAKPREEGIWLLFIGSNSVQAEKMGDAYRAVYTCLSRLQKSSISLSEIRLMHTSSPTIRDALDLRKRHRDEMLLRISGMQLGELAVDEAYIYSPAPEAANGNGPETFVQANFTGETEAIFGVPQADGSYKALKGKMHFKDGLLIQLSLNRGGSWGISGSPIGPVVVHLFSDIRPWPGDTPVNPKRCLGNVLKLYFLEGRFVRGEPAGEAKVDLSDLSDAA